MITREQEIAVADKALAALDRLGKEPMPVGEELSEIMQVLAEAAAVAESFSTKEHH